MAKNTYSTVQRHVVEVIVVIASNHRRKSDFKHETKITPRSSSFEVSKNTLADISWLNCSKNSFSLLLNIVKWKSDYLIPQTTIHDSTQNRSAFHD